MYKYFFCCEYIGIHKYSRIIIRVIRIVRITRVRVLRGSRIRNIARYIPQMTACSAFSSEAPLW